MIINRFNDAVYELSLAIKAERMHDPVLELRHKRNAGSAMYQVLEWSYKNHLDHLSPRIKRDYFGFGKNLGNMTQGMTLHGSPPINTLSLNINLAVLKDNKSITRNNPEHDGDIPDLSAQKLVIDEVRKVVLAFIDSNASLKKISDFDRINNIPTWDEFYSSCDKFNSEERNYILIIGPSQKIAPEHLKNIGQLPWNLIFDFDPNSKLLKGFYNSAFENIVPSPHILTVMEADSQNFSLHSQSHYHFFANGIISRQETIEPDYNRWNQKFEKKIEKIIERFAKTYNVPTKVIILWDNRKYIGKICEKLFNAFSDKAEFVFTINQNDNLTQTIEDCPNSSFVSITFSEIASGVNDFSKTFGIKHDQYLKFQLPHIDIVSGILTPEECYNLEEDFEVLHNKIIQKENNEDRRDFLVGNPITWYGLKKHFDIDRKKTAIIRDAIRQKLSGGGFHIFHLCHEPGVGGTTIGRRIAWEIKDDFPVLILKEYRGEITADKVRQVYDKTKKCVLVIMEGHIIGLDNIKPFYDAVARQNRPVVFLIIRRGYENIVDGEIPFVSNLSDSECIDFINEYKPFLNEYNNSIIIERKKDELNKIYNNNEPNEKNPFYIGLVTFEEGFFALNDYIEKFIQKLDNEEKKKIVLYLSIVYDYLARPLPASFFTKIVNRGGLPESHVLRLEDYLPKEFESILIAEKSEGARTKFWRPRHHLFAKELKEQILSGSDLHNNLWSQNIAEWSVRFIEDSSINTSQQSDYVVEILQDLFIGDRQIRGDKKFTPLIEAIRGKDGKEKVFKKLVECYPEQPHFWAHLARYYSFLDHNMEEALINVERAIQLSESNGNEDPLLFHIKGMCLREAAYIIMEEHHEKRSAVGYVPDSEKINKVQQLVEDSGQLFGKVRKLRGDEYGYIAHIQMLVRVIDFGQSISGKTPSEFFNTYINSWYGECLDLAEELLENVKRINIDHEANERVLNCEQNLLELFDQFDTILQGWENALKTSKNKPRIRRQIARAYQKKNPLYYQDNKTVRRILEYMEENILDEPANEKNIYLWFQTARYAQYVTLNDSIDKLSKWKVNSSSTDAIYYFYILQVLKAFEGYSDAREDAKKLIIGCSKKSNNLPNRTSCYEWYGNGGGISCLVNSKNLDDTDNIDSKLRLVKGVISEYTHAGDGRIEINGLQVFFRPSQANEGTGGFTKDDLNKEVEFYLGFSYDGLRADSYSVKLVGASRNPYKKFSERERAPKNLTAEKTFREKKNKSTLEAPITEKLQQPKVLRMIDLQNKDAFKLKHSYSNSDIGKRVTGKIVFLQPFFGHILDENNSILFFHKNEIKIFKQLKIDDAITFEVGLNNKGICATKLILKRV